MMAHAGSAMGYRFVTLDPTPDSPCGQVAEQIVAAYDDREAARELAKRSDVITYEFENVDADVAAMLMEESYVPQGSELLYTTQHRLREKRAIEAAGVQVAPYARNRERGELQEAVGRFGLPCVLKTATGGYDGKGQWVIRAWTRLSEAVRNAEPWPKPSLCSNSSSVSTRNYRSLRREVRAARSKHFPRRRIFMWIISCTVHRAGTDRRSGAAGSGAAGDSHRGIARCGRLDRSRDVPDRGWRAVRQ